MDEPSARWSANLVAPSGTGLRVLLARLVDCHSRKRAIARADLHLLTSQRLPWAAGGDQAFNSGSFEY
jgi:hypothetical protein